MKQVDERQRKALARAYSILVEVAQQQKAAAASQTVQAQDTAAASTSTPKGDDATGVYTNEQKQ